jgi:hypothetical protein
MATSSIWQPLGKSPTSPHPRYAKAKQAYDHTRRVAKPALIDGSNEARLLPLLLRRQHISGNAFFNERRLRSNSLRRVTADFFCLRKAGNALE